MAEKAICIQDLEDVARAKLSKMTPVMPPTLSSLVKKVATMLRPTLRSKSTKTRTISTKFDRAYFDMYQTLTLVQRFLALPSHFH